MSLLVVRRRERTRTFEFAVSVRWSGYRGDAIYASSGEMQHNGYVEGSTAARKFELEPWPHRSRLRETGCVEQRGVGRQSVCFDIHGVVGVKAIAKEENRVYTPLGAIFTSRCTLSVKFVS